MLFTFLFTLLCVFVSIVVDAMSRYRHGALPAGLCGAIFGLLVSAVVMVLTC